MLLGWLEAREDWESLKPGIEPMEGGLQALATLIEATEARFWVVVSKYCSLGLLFEARRFVAPLAPLLTRLFSRALSNRPFEMAVAKKRQPEAEDVMLTR